MHYKHSFSEIIMLGPVFVLISAIAAAGATCTDPKASASSYTPSDSQVPISWGIRGGGGDHVPTPRPAPAFTPLLIHSYYGVFRAGGGGAALRHSVPTHRPAQRGRYNWL